MQAFSICFIAEFVPLFRGQSVLERDDAPQGFYRLASRVLTFEPLEEIHFLARQPPLRVEGIPHDPPSLAFLATHHQHTYLSTSSTFHT